MRAVSAGATAYAFSNPRGKDGNAVNTYAALALYRPAYYVEVAPGVRRFHKLTLEDRDDPGRPAIKFDPTEICPRRPVSPIASRDTKSRCRGVPCRRSANGRPACSRIYVPVAEERCTANCHRPWARRG
jgi:hypothetical protein